MNAYYWFNHGWSRSTPKTRIGPREGALIRADGTTVRLDFANPADMHLIPATSNVVGLALGPASRTTEWSATGRDGRGFGVYVTAETLDGAVSALRLEIEARNAEEARIAAEPAEHLERELARFDWYAHYSDSHGVYAASERHQKQILEIAKAVPVERARELWAKHAPRDVGCPL